MNSSYVRGSFFTEKLRVDFSTTEVLSGHSDCLENIIVNCGSVSAAIAFPIIAFGVIVFGIYTAKRREQQWQSPADLGGLKTQEASDDEEGFRFQGRSWVFDEEEGWETKDEDKK
jgi:hypothetical protein